MSERHITFDMIVHAVCAVSGRSRVEIMSDGKSSVELQRLRQICWWLARKTTPLPLETIARLSRGRHHTSVMSGVDAVDRLRGADDAFRMETDALRGTLVALERHGMLRLATVADPIATARRVLAAPEREAVRVPLIEIVALCRLVVETFGEDDEPTPSPLSHAQTSEETEYAA